MQTITASSSRQPAGWRRWWQRLALDWLERIKMREPFFMMAMAITIGICAGFGAVAFRHLIELMNWLFWGAAHATPDFLRELPVWRLILIPAAGGLLVGPIVAIAVREARGHGVPEVMLAVAKRDGVIRGRVAFAKTLASAITLGSGGSAGAEGPIIQIGSAIGSKLGQLAQVSRKNLRTFVACGAAAGVAATFNAPIAGSLFAVEVILGQFGVAQFSPIVISAVVATVISRHYLGGEAVFSVPGYELVSPVELGPYLVLGLLCGVLAVVTVRVLYGMEDLFERGERVPRWIKPALGGLLMGGSMWLLPQVYGDGMWMINQLLNQPLAWGLLLVLAFAKLVAMSLTLGSGGSGGVFAPSLFIGAALGGSFGHGVGALLGPLAGPAGGYALVAMGGLVAGTIHAPITAIIMIFEITNSYQIILPLMLVCIMSTVLSTRLQRESIYTLKLARRGINLLGGQSLDVLKRFTVRQALRADAPRIEPHLPLQKVVERVMDDEHTQFYVTEDDGRLVGVVHLSELSRIVTRREGLDQVLLAEDMAHAEAPVCLPDEPLNRALLRFEQSGLIELPVVEDAASRVFLGVIRYKEVIALYNNEIMQRETAEGVAERMVLSDRMERVKIADGISMIEVDPPTNWFGQTLAELHLTSRFGVRVMLIKRRSETAEGRTIRPESPGGDSRIEEGDTLIVYGPEAQLDHLPQV
jgi:chloride channel protein, CIC family